MEARTGGSGYEGGGKGGGVKVREGEGERGGRKGRCHGITRYENMFLYFFASWMNDF